MTSKPGSGLYSGGIYSGGLYGNQQSKPSTSSSSSTGKLGSLSSKHFTSSFDTSWKSYGKTPQPQPSSSTREYGSPTSSLSSLSSFTWSSGNSQGSSLTEPQSSTGINSKYNDDPHRWRDQQLQDQERRRREQESIRRNVREIKKYDPLDPPKTTPFEYIQCHAALQKIGYSSSVRSPFRHIKATWVERIHGVGCAAFANERVAEVFIACQGTISWRKQWLSNAKEAFLAKHCLINTKRYEKAIEKVQKRFGRRPAFIAGFSKSGVFTSRCEMKRSDGILSININPHNPEDHSRAVALTTRDDILMKLWQTRYKSSIVGDGGHELENMVKLIKPEDRWSDLSYRFK